MLECEELRERSSLSRAVRLGENLSIRAPSLFPLPPVDFRIISTPDDWSSLPSPTNAPLTLATAGLDRDSSS